VITIFAKLTIYSYSECKLVTENINTSEHPRLRASIPTEPVPLYKSNHRPGLNAAGQPPAALVLKNQIISINRKSASKELYGLNGISNIST